MLGPNTPDGCVGCTFATDSLNGIEPHLNGHDVTFVLASRAPLETLDASKQRMGWSIPWASSGSSDFDRDFRAWNEADRANGTGYNFATPRRAGIDTANDAELMALSVFVLEDGAVYHTYTCLDRGTDVLNVTWQLLDRTPKGRENAFSDGWPRRRDEYAD